MRSKSIRAASALEFKIALANSMTDAGPDDPVGRGFMPTLAILFISVKQDRNAVCEILAAENIDIIGATSAGEFIDGHQSHGEMAVLLMDINKADYAILFNETKETDVISSATEMCKTAKSLFDNPAFILCSTCISESGDMYEGDAMIHTIQQEVGNETPIFGGMAGADGMLKGTYVFTANKSTDFGFVTLVLNSDRINLFGIAISGWKPMGKVRTVTKCEDGWMYTIDDQPALDMYLRYLGQSVKSGEEAEKVFFAEDVGFFYPFLAIEGDDPILRTPLKVDKEKNAIQLDFPIPTGKQLQFTLPPDFDIVETVLNKATALKEERNVEADALLVFSCLGRFSVLGPMVQQENEGLHEIWKAPMAGFFSYGEYGNGENNKNRFHSTTCSWVVLKEK